MRASTTSMPANASRSFSFCSNCSLISSPPLRRVSSSFLLSSSSYAYCPATWRRAASLCTRTKRSKAFMMERTSVPICPCALPAMVCESTSNKALYVSFSFHTNTRPIITGLPVLSFTLIGSASRLRARRLTLFVP